MSKVLREFSCITEKDCFYIVERHKSEFTWPIHTQEDFELNFVEGGSGVRRVVGDSMETIGNYDLVLITGDGLEHAWEQGECKAKDIREITIQFSPQLLDEALLTRNQFASVRKMFERAQMGLAFSMPTIMKVYRYLDTLPSMQNSMEQFLDMIKILHILSEDPESRALASDSFAARAGDADSPRIRTVKDYIAQHYAEEITLEDLASQVAMAPSAFSRYFKQHVGRGPMDYIIEVRLGKAARMLVDTNTGIAEICYACGFNNLSNFNRSFKSRRGFTPREFRALFVKNRVLV